MSIDQSLAVLGIGISILFGVAAFFTAKVVRTRRYNQRQTVGKGATAIQSGRDTHFGDKR